MTPLCLTNVLTVAALTAATAVPLTTLGSAPAQAQPAVPTSAVRAINLARTTAVAQNGGLSRYRPAQCMFQTANPENPCLINTPDDDTNNNARDNRNNNSNTYVFRFQGGAPGWQQQNQRPTVETEITISADGRNVVQVNYNGSPR
ncbi:MAG: hypothetical protein RLZZ336_2156 [Cyanobacteriota bacterium]